MSDRLCRENGLSVVVPEKGSKGKNYAAYHKEKSAKAKLKIAVDTLIPQVNSFEELLSRLQGLGYEIKRGKFALVDTADMEIDDHARFKVENVRQNAVVQLRRKYL